ncbi:hypothetical protein [Chamaesiphon sp. OTE_8_metabat_110]|uniref:hypothetical protein n=1 Tax=Chamaesiphon sp. OTE_8_metabat_110 TaxID=2964696 RepID=UPI00286C3824|nr:hypothetical protein [Chamaesiphon sp. OTE_8_metabat_110]
MTDWKFLIQRQGDRGWRPIETGNLQLMEGKYRIVATSQLSETPIQLRITHQTSDLPTPQRRSRSCQQTSTASGVVVILPFTHLQAGIWQFVCSGSDDSQAAWHRILKLRVLIRTPAPTPIQIAPPTVQTAPAAPIQPPQPPVAQPAKTLSPTAPLLTSPPIEPENWADGLARLLEQLERESLQPQPSGTTTSGTLAEAIQLHTIFAPPSQLISLSRSTFSGLIPGNRLTISGECNLQLLNPNLSRSTKIEKLLICLRHPQTAEIVSAIERTLPPNLDIFSFQGHLDLPAQPKVGLLLGEVSFYDKHHIQLGASGFTIALNLNPIHESELSLLQLFDRDKENSAANLDRLTQELKTEALTIGTHSSSHLPQSSIPSLTTPLKPSQLTPSPAAAFTHPDVTPVDPAPTQHRFDRSISNPVTPPPTVPTTSSRHPQDFADELDLGISYSPLDLSPEARNYPNLEIVIDD